MADENGSVGIGTVAPEDRLHVYGGSRTRLRVQSGTAGAYLRLVPADSDCALSLFQNPEDLAWTIGNDVSNGNLLRFQNSTEAVRMVIDQGGHVGIRHPTPRALSPCLLHCRLDNQNRWQRQR